MYITKNMIRLHQIQGLLINGRFGYVILMESWDILIYIEIVIIFFRILFPINIASII